MAENNMIVNETVEQTLAHRAAFHGKPKYEVVSLVAFLIGVPDRIFENEHEPPQMEVYNRLKLDKNARIIRNLCLLRTDLERNYGAINREMQRDGFRTILSMPEYVNARALAELSEDGVKIPTPTRSIVPTILEINRKISDRINNCKSLVPLWLDWSYLREIFIMPEGHKETGAKAAADLYYANKNYYPYQVYMNWSPRDEGNILYNDERFVSLLYEWHEDLFEDYSRVSDVSSYTKTNVFDFIEEGERTVFVVDCENSDPYNLCAALASFPEEVCSRISKIILYDDVHTTSAWELLQSQTEIPVERILIERVKENKSLVDIRLTTGVCREFFENKADSFVLVSSDSDYWGLISSLPEARFLVMVEHEKCGPDIKEALISSGIFYCYIDDFYSGGSNDLKITALLREVTSYLQQAVSFNVNDMLQIAFRNTRVEMTPHERNQFYDKYIRGMRLVVDQQGNASIELNR